LLVGIKPRFFVCWVKPDLGQASSVRRKQADYSVFPGIFRCFLGSFGGRLPLESLSSWVRFYIF
jgi:hypothetical protein